MMWHRNGSVNEKSVMTFYQFRNEKRYYLDRYWDMQWIKEYSYAHYLLQMYLYLKRLEKSNIDVREALEKVNRWLHHYKRLQERGLDDE